MTLHSKEVGILGFLWERRKSAIRGRQDAPRRPERSGKPSGKGYSGKDGQMTGRGVSGEREPAVIPGALKKVPTKVDAVTEFDSMEDWMLSMILVAVMHAFPDLSPDDAMKEGKTWVRRLYLPRTDYLWRKQIARLQRHGLRAEASKIRREMYKLI